MITEWYEVLGIDKGVLVFRVERQSGITGTWRGVVVLFNGAS